MNRSSSNKELINRNLIDNGVVKTIKVTIGVPGATGVNQNFTSAANKTEQGLQLTGTTLLPAFCKLVGILIVCTVDFTGSAGDETGFSCKIGTSSGGTQIANGVNVDDINDLNSKYFIADTLLPPVSTATSIYISATPTVNNWNEFSAGKITCWVTYIDNNAI